MRAEVDLVELSSHRVIRARHAPAPTRITSENSAPDSPDEKDSTSLTSPEPAAQEPGSAQYGGWTGAAWCWWGSWDDPGRERVQICHKGAPRRYRPRRKARNINDSSRTLRLDPGLCGRFGQPASLRTPGKGATGRSVAGTGLWEGRPRPGDDHNGHPGERTGPTGHGDGLPGRPPGSETCTSHSKVQFQPSFSSAKCTSRRRSGPAAAAADRDDDPAVHDDPDLQAAASGEEGSMRAQLDKIHLSSIRASSARTM